MVRFGDGAATSRDRHRAAEMTIVGIAEAVSAALRLASGTS
jgi:hypothetical protein